jgi:hypothetical protein
MARPPVIDADLIAGLRNRVVAHNKSFPHAPVKLGVLKKVWIEGWRRSRGSRAGAEAAVDKHLKKLASLPADMRSVEALAKAEFDESKHRRDEKGRFAPKGGNAPSIYRNVATPSQHAQAMRENEGYRAANTQVIPETRFSTFGGPVGAAVGMGLSALGGAFADKGPDIITRAKNRAIGSVVGGVAGIAARTGHIVGGEAINAVRRKLGKPPLDVHDAARTTGKATRRKVANATKNLLNYVDKIAFTPSRKIIESAKRSAAKKNLTGLRRALHMGRGRLAAATTAAVIPGVVTAYALRNIGNSVGPYLDAAFPRRVQKVAADPRSVEVLQKASLANVINVVRNSAAANALRNFKAALAGNISAGKIQSVPNKGQVMARRILAPHMRSVKVGAGLGAIGGAALGAGAYAGARRYYRDEKGRFTSKERDVSYMLGSAALGALAGGLAGAAFVRGKNRAIARELAERLGRLKVNIKDPQTGATVERTLAEAKGLIDNKVLHSAVGGKKRVPFSAADVKLKESLGAQPSFVPAAGANPTDSGRMGYLLARAKQRVMNRMGVGVNRALQQADAAELRMRNAWQAGKEAWDAFQVDEAIRSRLREAFANKGLFQYPKNAPKDVRDTTTAINRVLMARPTLRPDGKIDDPLGDMIQAVRALKPSEKTANSIAKVKTGTIFDKMTVDQKKAIVREIDAFTKYNKALAEHKNAVNEFNRLSSMKPEEMTAGDKARWKLHQKYDLVEYTKNKLEQTPNPFIKDAIKPYPASKEELNELISTVRNKLTAPVNRLKNQTKALDELAARRILDTLSALERAWTRNPLPGEKGVQRLWRPISEVGQQARTIISDVGASVKPKWERLKTILLGGMKDNAVAAGARQGGLLPKAYGAVKATTEQAWAWIKANPKKAAGILSALTAMGVVEIGADGKLDFSFRSVPEAARQLVDKKTRPEPAMYFLNNGKDVAYLMLGRTIAKKGQEPQDIILAGTIIRENGTTQTVQPMMPLKMFLENNSGGRGGGGTKPNVELNNQQKRQFTEAIRALGDKIKRSDEDEEEYYLFRAHDDNSKDREAAEYMNLVAKTAGSSGGGNAFYSYLASVFTSEAAPLLKESEKRALLFGGKIKDKSGNEQKITGVFEVEGAGKNGRAAAEAYRNRSSERLVDALIARVKELPPPDEEQAKLLRHMGRLLASKHSPASIGEHGKQKLFTAIADRIKSSSTDSGLEPPKQIASSSSSGAYEAELHTYTNFLSGSIGRYNEYAPADFDDALKAVAQRTFQNAVREIRSNPPYPNMTEEDIFREARLLAEERWLDEQAKGRLHNDLLRQKIEEFQARRSRKSFSLTDLAKIAASSASVALLNKAEVPQFRQQQHFDETKVRRIPRGQEGAGRFAPKGGGTQIGAKPRQNVGAYRVASKNAERGYFEPVRFGGTIGQSVGSQAGWEIASRFLPGPLKNMSAVSRLSYRLASSMIGGAGGQSAGEALGRATYKDPRRAPGSWEPKNRTLGEEASRMGGAMAGSMLGALSRKPLKSFTIGVGGQLAGDEIAAQAYHVARKHYGKDAAARAARGASPRARSTVA